MFPWRFGCLVSLTEYSISHFGHLHLDKTLKETNKAQGIWIPHLFLWLGLHWSSTAQLHHLLVDHLGWEHLTKPGLIAELYGSAKLETIYLRKQFENTKATFLKWTIHP